MFYAFKLVEKSLNQVLSKDSESPQSIHRLGGKLATHEHSVLPSLNTKSAPFIHLYRENQSFIIYLKRDPNSRSWLERNDGRMNYANGCPIVQVLFTVYSPCIWLIYMHFECSQRLLQHNFDTTKCKIPIPRYISCIS